MHAVHLPTLKAWSMTSLCLALFLVLSGLFASGTHADAAQALIGIETGLSLPRFVSLKAGKVNVRVGPSRSHPVLWVYQRKGMPVEVIAEFEHWRRIRDVDGDIGWIFHSLLDGRRKALVLPTADGEPLMLHALPTDNSEIVAAAEPGVVAKLEACRDGWCRISAGGYAGWTAKDTLWGIYPEDSFE